MGSPAGPLGMAVLARPHTVAQFQPATLLEVKRYGDADGPLVYFVRFKDTDHRLGTWLERAHLCEASATAAIGGHDGFSPIPCEPLVSPTPTEAIARTPGEATIDFLERRLWRDMASPNSVRYIFYLGWKFQPWYFAPLGTLHAAYDPSSPVLLDAHLCPFTLVPFPDGGTLLAHVRRHSSAFPRPPGTEIYCDPTQGFSIFEIDGAEHRPYCRNISLVAKSFLENKLVGHDVGIYVCWEKGVSANNLACITTLPCFQGLGLGSVLIAASYHIGYRRGIVGTPERPLSDLGDAAYFRFWRDCVWRWAAATVVPQALAGDAADAVSSGARGTTMDADADDDNDDWPAPARAGSAARSVRGGAKGAKGIKGGGTATATAAAAAAETAAPVRATIQEMAHAMRLEASDVADTVARLGLLHRAERGLELLVPREVVLAWAAVRRARAAANAPEFRPELLKATFRPERVAT